MAMGCRLMFITWSLCYVVHSTAIVRHGKPAYSLDASTQKGVRIEQVNGSRIEYDPLPGGMMLYPRTTLSASFKTDSPTGILLVLVDNTYKNMVIAFLMRGRLIFIRRCGKSSALEVFRSNVHNGRWHHLQYVHSTKGGDLIIDGESHFRQYHMGRCPNFRSVFFGGVPDSFPLVHLNGIRRSFNGCIKNLRLNRSILPVAPRYYAVSTCEG